MNRFVKFWRDHIYNRCVDIELRLDLADAPYRTPAAENGLTFFVITDPQDVRLDTLARDFPRQSRTFRKDIQNGCVAPDRTAPAQSACVPVHFRQVCPS